MGALSLPIGRRRTSVWGLLALTAAIATGVAVYSYLSWLRAQIPVAGRLVPMVVAAVDIDPGVTISFASVRVVDHPERYLPPLALSDVAQAIGKVAAAAIPKGEAVTEARLAAKGGLSHSIPQGMRIYSLSLDGKSRLDPQPAPGDRVDVIATFPREVTGEATSITILRMVEVAAVGGEAVSSSRLRLGEALEKSLTLTLYVNPVDAERLAMAESMGRITIVIAPAEGPAGKSPKPIRPRDLGTG